MQEGVLAVPRRRDGRSASGRRSLPSRESKGGARKIAVIKEIAVTKIAVPASESNSEPGRTKIETSIEANRVVPANRVVRPAVRLVDQAASPGLLPAASSSRKRETIKRA